MEDSFAPITFEILTLLSPSHPQIELYTRLTNRVEKMSNASKTGQQEEVHADPSESNLLGELAFEDMIEGSERTNRVKEGT